MRITTRGIVILLIFCALGVGDVVILLMAGWYFADIEGNFIKNQLRKRNFSEYLVKYIGEAFWFSLFTLNTGFAFLLVPILRNLPLFEAKPLFSISTGIILLGIIGCAIAARRCFYYKQNKEFSINSLQT